jgi:hypothetical protein
MPTFEFPRPDKNLGTLADVSSNQFQWTTELSLLQYYDSYYDF